MKQVIVNIPDNKLQLFVEMVKSMSFVEKVESKDLDNTTSKQVLLSEIKEAVDNLNKVKQGKSKARPAKGLLDVF